MTDYRPGDEPFTIPMPPGMDASMFFRFNPGVCDECEYRAIGVCGSAGVRGAYCSVHKDQVKARVFGLPQPMDKDGAR